MLPIDFREVNEADIEPLPTSAPRNRTEEFWNTRITAYLNKEHHPQKALSTHIIYIATLSDTVIGFLGGHLTTRYECNEELQWITVVSKYRRRGIASDLLHLLAKWFIGQKAFKICVDPGQEIARRFYISNGAESLNKRWLFWEDIREVLQD
jgi:ribosomal protein S18 acetylase RimI-like enzyme